MIFPKQFQDWELYYQGVCCKIIDGQKDTRWTKVGEFIATGPLAHNCEVHVCDEHELNYQITVTHEKPYTFDPTFPDSRFYFYKGQSLYLHRTARRTATKGLTPDTGIFTNPLSAYVPDNFADPLICPSHWKDYIRVLNNPANDIIYGVDEAMDMLKDSISVPIDHQWCLSWALNGHDPYFLWHRNEPVASVRRNYEVTLMNPTFGQEIADMFPRLELV